MSVASAMPATVTSLPMGSQSPSALRAAATPSATLNQNDFLRLLTTQLQKQNPLNPVSPSDFAAELAQFSTATGVQTLNTTLSASNGLQAAALVGHKIAVAGNALVVGQGGTATGAFALPVGAKTVAVTVAGPAGNVVANLDLGTMAAGSQSFTWNGQGLDGKPAPAGNYSFTVNAVGSDGARIAATPYSVVPVTSVSLGGQAGPMLSLGGGVAPVALSAVQQVY